MKGDKIGGYQSDLTPRIKLRQRLLEEAEGEESKSQAELSPENKILVNRLVDSLGVTELKNVFKDYLRKSGVPAENLNEEVLDDVLARPLEGGTATYSAFLNRITVSITDEDFVSLKRVFEQRGVIPKVLRMKMELALMHELCHAFSRVRYLSKDARNSQSIVTAESGYTFNKSVIRQSMRPEKIGTRKEFLFSLEAFNEGVTQRIAEEAYLEYGRRIGLSSETEHFLGSYVRSGVRKFDRYTIYMNQVENMCECIARYIGVRKEDVWNSFKRGYFEKPQLFHEETAALFKETFGENFLSEYEKFNNETPIDEIGEFDDRYGFSHPDEYAGKWLNHLGISKNR